MNWFKNFVAHSNSTGRAAEKWVRRCVLAVPAAFVGTMLILTAHAQNPAPLSFSLAPASPAVAGCLPEATARVTVFPKEEIRGVDTFDLKAEGLAADASFAVFLTELPGAPFGATQYIGDFTTNAAGRGSLRVDSIVEEAFSSTVVGGTRVRKELNHVVIWFADPAADDFCTGTVTTPFDGDGQAGISALSSNNFLPGAPLP
jgi:hypothetical protein